MKLISGFILLATICAQTQSAPQGYGSGNVGQGVLPGVPGLVPVPAVPVGPNCKVEYKIVNDITYIEEIKKVCVPKIESVCTTVYKKQCTPYEDKVCRTEYREQCETKYKPNCYEQFKEVPEHYTEEECLDLPVKVCEKHWVEVGYNQKVWEDDPATCKELPKTECKPVDKVRTKKEPYTKCDDVPYQDCQKVPEEKCDLVTKEKCEDVPAQECKDVEHPECHDEHNKIPKPISKKVPVNICIDHAGGVVETPGEPVEVFDPRSGAEGAVQTGIRSGDVEENAVPEKNVEDPDKIHFGVDA